MIQEPLTITRANAADGDEIFALYHSLIDDPYGTWSEEYPTREDVRNDLAENIVYVMRDGTGRIVSAIVDELDIHEFDNLAQWYTDVKQWAQLGQARRCPRRAGTRHCPQDAGLRDGAGEGKGMRRRPLSGRQLQHSRPAFVCQAEL